MSGFVLLRLLQEPDPALSALPQRWLTSLLDAAAAPQQSVDNIIRRSAGGPYAVTAILLAEPLQQTQKARWVPKTHCRGHNATPVCSTTISSVQQHCELLGQCN